VEAARQCADLLALQRMFAGCSSPVKWRCVSIPPAIRATAAE
jgi:hypothetical protein